MNGNQTKNLGGRRPKLNEELIEQFAAEIAEGLPIQYTCDLLLVNQVTMNEWMRQGKYDDDNEVDSLQRAFCIAVKKAYAQFLQSSRNLIRKGAPGWQGAAWWLERTNKDFQMNSDTAVVNENIIVNTKMAKKEKK